MIAEFVIVATIAYTLGYAVAWRQADKHDEALMRRLTERIRR